jgi:hypothetical protein
MTRVDEELQGRSLLVAGIEARQSTQTVGASLVVLHDWIVHDHAPHCTVRGEERRGRP